MKNKKKNKPYYKKTIQNKDKKQNQNDNKVNLFSNNSFLLAIGFLIYCFSKYILKNQYKPFFSLVGLLIMLYSFFNIYKVDKKTKSKNIIILDLFFLLVISIMIILNLHLIILNF